MKRDTSPTIAAKTSVSACAAGCDFWSETIRDSWNRNDLSCDRHAHTFHRIHINESLQSDVRRSIESLQNSVR